MLEAVSWARTAVGWGRYVHEMGIAMEIMRTSMLPHLDFDKDAAVANIRAVNPGIPIFEISARTEAGFGTWIEWIEARVLEKRNRGFGRE